MRQMPVCQSAWQELKVPDELQPFYPQAGSWHAGRLFAVRVPPYGKYASRERGLVYAPRSGFSALPEEGGPALDEESTVVATDDELVFISSVNDTGALASIWSYDPTLQSWSDVPLPDSAGGVTAAVGRGNRIAIDYERVRDDGSAGAPVEDAFLEYGFGDDAWTELSQPPIVNWATPALAWTGSELLAWGGDQRAGGVGDPTPISAGARYDPTRDAWTPMSDKGTATSGRFGASLVWTDPDAVAWGSGASTAGRYDPALDRWRTVSAPAGAGFGDEYVAVEGVVATWSGTGTYSDRLATYDPRTDTWSEAPTRCGPSPRNRPLLVGTDDGVIVWGGDAECADASDAVACADRELQRAFYLPNAALLGEVHDSGECTCPVAR